MLGTQTVAVEQTTRTDTYAAARKLGFALHYLIRNATRSHGETHGAVDKFANALCAFVDHAAQELRAGATS